MNNKKTDKKDFSRMPNTVNLGGLLIILDIILNLIFGSTNGSSTNSIIDEELGHPKYTFKDFLSSLGFAIIFLVIFYFWFNYTNK